MKSHLLSMVAPAVAIGGMALVLGCSAETKKAGLSPAAASTNASTSVVATTDIPVYSGAPAPGAEALPEITKAPTLSPAAEQVVQLAQAGLGDDVLLAYIERSSSDYQLEIEDILYLHDLGLSAPVIAAMVRRDQTSPLSNADTGRAELSNTSSPSAQPAGQAADATATVNSTPSAAPDASTASLAAETPQTFVSDGPPPQTVNYNYFYNSLASYGNWVEDANYGWCWQPTVAAVNSGWRPYCDGGRWLWSDCGWYWQSSYSWGSIPFHYGRWCYGQSGWAWVPGTVWGPSWVTWCNSGSYCGWAPLPPACGYAAGVGLTFGGGSVGVGFNFGLGYNCWTFVPAGYVCNYSPWYYCVPPSRVPTIVNNGTMVNNYINGSGNNVVVNVGPGVERIAAVSRGEIRRVAIRDVNAAPGTVIKADRLDRVGRTLTVFRPTLPQQAPAPPEHILARQREVRRNTETLVKSDVVKLARAETARGATASNARPSPVASRPTQTAPAQVSSRSEVRASPAAQNSRSLSAPLPGSGTSGSAPAYSVPNRTESVPTAHGEVRPTTRNATTRSGQPPVTPNPAPAFGQNTPATRTETRSTTAYPPQSPGRPASPSYRSEARNPQPVPPGVTPRYQAPAPSYNPPPRTYAPAPVPQSPPVAAPPARSAPAPSSAPPPAVSRPQPSSSSSPAPRSGSGRNPP